MKDSCKELLVTGYLFEKKLMDHYYSLYRGELSKLQIQTLSIIGNHPGVLSKEIAARLSVPKQYVSKMLGHLISFGYVSTKMDPNDKRAQHAFLTENGSAYLQQHIDQSYEDFSVMMNSLSESEAQELMNAFSVLRKLLDKL